MTNQQTNFTCAKMEFSATLVHQKDSLQPDIRDVTPILTGSIVTDNTSCISTTAVQVKIDFNRDVNKTMKDPPLNGTLLINFRNTSNVVYLEKVDVQLDGIRKLFCLLLLLQSLIFPLFSKIADSPFLKENEILSFAIKNTYHCESGADIELVSNKNKRKLTLKLRNMRLNLFRTQNDTNYEPETICLADVKSSKTVPIIVSVVLAGMVVIILVGYIIIRRREDRSAYQSV